MITQHESPILSQLRSTLSKMELSLSAITDAIIWVDPSGKVQWCNERFSALIGLPNIQILGKQINDVAPLKCQGKFISWQEDIINQPQKHQNDFYQLTVNDDELLFTIFCQQFSTAQHGSSIVVVMYDVTEKQRNLAQIKLLASIPEHNSAPIFSLDRNHQIIFANDAATELSKLWLKEYGRPLPNGFFNLAEKALANNREYLVEEICQELVFLFSITPDIAANYIYIYGTNITQRKKTEEKIVYLSQHDMLTNLYNRPAFDEALKRTLTTAYQNQTSFAILLLDLDNFKTVNDTFGHYIGDQLLINVAKLLQHNVRKDDFVARLGGDEFIILATPISNVTDATAIAKKILNIFRKPFNLAGHYFHVSASIGISVYPSTGEDETTLIKNADIALYAVKECGRNDFKIFSKEISHDFKRRMLVETELAGAITHKQFFLVYQPQYKLPEKEIVGIETLLRWRHPQLGLILPGEFISIAEKNGLITPIGEWVLKQACWQYMNWRVAGIINNNLKLAINISPIQFTKAEFVDFLTHILDETEMPPQNLELEITEIAVMSNVVNLDEILAQLRKIGVNISIDNFGIGYSSLMRIKNLPVSTLKIDRNLIKNMATNPDDAMIVKSIIALGKSLDLNVIPEGVETKEQLDLLMSYQCQLVQGFYFYKQPMEVDEMQKLLAHAD